MKHELGVLTIAGSLIYHFLRKLNFMRLQEKQFND